MKIIKIKLGVNQPSQKPIYLLSNGSLICDNFSYRGIQKNKFKECYDEILATTNIKVLQDILDVSNVKTWDAISIYDNYVVRNWVKSISAKKIKELANETYIRKIIEIIIPEFKRSVELKWKKIWNKSDPNNPLTPKKAWQIL